MNLRLPALICLAFFSLAHAQGERLTYNCDDGSRLEAEFSAEADGRAQAGIRFADRQLTLPQVPAASGARYLKAGISLHTKADEAVFDDGQGKVRFCTRADSSPPVAAPVAPATPGSFVEITGSVAYLARSTLPPDAVLIIRVQDTARAGAPALTLAEQRIDPGGRQAPIPFKLAVDRDLIGKNAQVTVAARIERKGTLLFINNSIHRALIDGHPRHVDVKLVPVGPAKSP